MHVAKKRRTNVAGHDAEQPAVELLIPRMVAPRAKRKLNRTIFPVMWS